MLLYDSQRPAKAVVKNADIIQEMQQKVVGCSHDAMEKNTIEKDISRRSSTRFTAQLGTVL